MKKFIFSAAALSLTGAALANGNEWSALDREVEALTSNLVTAREGISFGAYADVWYTNNSDSDTSGFGVNNARLSMSGGSGGFGAFAQYQLEGGALLDAYVTQDLGGMTLSIGRQKVMWNASSAGAEQDMFFETRSNIGGSFAGRDEGVNLSGGDGFNWGVGIADGSDGNADEYRMSAHGDMDFGGGMAAGVSYTSDGFSEGSTIVVDFSYAAESFNLGVEFADVSEDGGAFTGGDGSALATAADALGADSSPWAVAATMPLGGDSSIGIRYQDADTANGDTSIDVCYNYGNWSFQYTMTDDDTDTGTDTLLAGLQVGF